MSNRSDFKHSIEEHGGRNVIVIEDLDLGNMSVTNNIDNVLEIISKLEHITPVQYMVVYKDSNGVWDGYDVKTGEFVSLNEDHWRDAVSHYIHLQLPKCHS